MTFFFIQPIKENGYLIRNPVQSAKSGIGPFEPSSIDSINWQKNENLQWGKWRYKADIEKTFSDTGQYFHSKPPQKIGNFDGNLDCNIDGNFDRNFYGKFDGNFDGNYDGDFDGNFDGNMEIFNFFVVFCISFDRYAAWTGFVTKYPQFDVYI